MNTELHKRVADKMIAKFKELEGVEQVKETIVSWFWGEKIQHTIIYYVLESLVLKGYLFKSEIIVYSPTNIGHPRYYLSSKGWAYENYDKVIYDEKRQSDLEDALLKSSVASNKWSPKWAFFAALFAGFSFLTSVLTSIFTFINSEKLSPKLEQIDSTLRGRKENTYSIQSSLKEINHSIEKLSDSVSAHLKK